jgi:hypothetical protein
MRIPPELGEREHVVAAVRAGVEVIENALATEIRQGARVVGRRRVLAQSWKDSPTSVEPRRNLRPRFACGNEHDRIITLLAYRAFLDAYQAARKRWLAQQPSVFPVGTYWLRRFAGVPVAAA